MLYVLHFQFSWTLNPTAPKYAHHRADCNWTSFSTLFCAVGQQQTAARVNLRCAHRCLSSLQHIDIIKPGAAELQHMCNHVCQSQHVPPIDPDRSRQFCSLLSASRPVASTVSHTLSGLVVQCWMLLRQGLGTVLLSLGAHGCAVCQLMHARAARQRVPLGLVEHRDRRASLVMIYLSLIHI